METLSPLTPQERAQQKLEEWQRHIAAMSPGDQLLISIAAGSLRGWMEQHGEAGRVAFALVQLEAVAGPAQEAQVLQ